MSSVQSPVSDMLITVKSRELQRAMFAEMQGADGTSHFLAAAHLALVLAEDYDQAGDSDLAWRSRLSAASCFWRAGQSDHARKMLDALKQSHPGGKLEVDEIVSDLAASYPEP